MKKKILSVVLTLLLVLNLVPVMAFAESSPIKRFSLDDSISGGSSTGLADKAFGGNASVVRTVSGGKTDAFSLEASAISDAKKPDLKRAAPDDTIKAQPFKSIGTGFGALSGKALLGKIKSDKPLKTANAGEIAFDEEISSLDDLKALFTNGGSGRLVKNITADGVLFVDKDVKLSLNGCVLNLASLSNIMVGNGVNFDLYDESEAVHYFTPDESGLWIWDNTDDTTGTETLSGGVICGGFSPYGGAVDVDGGTFTMHGGNITGSTANCGGAVNVQGGSFIMNGGKIIGNTAPFGGGVFVLGGIFNMEDGIISKNTASSGGAVYDYYNGIFKMSGGTLSENEAQAGGAVFVDTCSFTMQNGEISENYSEYGGAVFVCYGNLKMTGGLFCGNTANYGGAVDIQNGSFTMTDGEISGNEAVQGGAVQIAIGTFTLQGGMLNGNSASYGGAVINFDKFIIDGGEISSNMAGYSGGAVYNLGTLTMNAGEINGNDAQAGGAVFIDGSTFTMNDGDIVCNKADQGGAVDIDSGELNMNGGKLGGNVAGIGGAVLVGESGEFTLSDGKLSDNVADYGGAVLNFNEFIMNDGEITGSSASCSGGAVYNLGTLTVNNGKISSNDAYYGGAVFNEVGSFTMEDGTMSGNTANDGGGVFVESGSFTMKSGKISGGWAVYGGGVLVNEGSFTMENGEISGNAALYGGGVETDAGTFTMQDGILTGNDGYCGGAVLNFAGFTMENGEISGNTAVSGGAIYNCLGELNLTAASDKQIKITGNDATDAYGAILNAGTLKLSGKVIIKDNTAANGFDNLGLTSDPVVILGALTGSQIYIAHADINDEYDAGVLTVDFAKNNPDAKADTFFTYDGTADFEIILNSDGEIEAVDAATLLLMAKEEAINAVNALISENTADEIKAVAQKAVSDITNAEDLTAVNEIKTAAINEIEALMATVCGYCGEIHPDNFIGRLTAFFHKIFSLIKNLFK